MPVEIVVPRLGWSMDEGTFGEWLAADGDMVNAGDMIFVLEGEKASQEIESFDSGVLHIPADAPQPGDTVVVGQLLGYLLAQGESAPHSRSSPVKPEPPGTLPQSAVAVPAPKTSSDPSSHSGSASRVIATPRARRKARELGVGWSHVRGTGRGGRIRERDVLASANQATTSHAPSEATAYDQSNLPGAQQTASPIRRTIAQRVMAGVHQTAPVTLTTTVNAKELFAYRERLRSERPGNSIPSYNDMLVSLVAAALSDCAALNACWRNDGIFIYDEVHIAVAVDTENGLVAPVIRNAAALSLDDIAARSRTLAEQARGGQLSQDQLQGGTFTITNLGMLDVDFFTPIINLPQSAILGVGRIADQPIVEEGQVVPGKTLSLSLTFDHRVIDGAPAARWLQQLAKMIERVGDHLSIVDSDA